MIIFSLSEILNLRERALLIAEPNNKDVEIFIVQADIVQEIFNVMSILIKIGLYADKRKKKLHKTEDMKRHLKVLKDELKEW